MKITSNQSHYKGLTWFNKPHLVVKVEYNKKVEQDEEKDGTAD
ncbi:MAG: hypothetical protein OEL89_00125 [Candidatus Peregrinibacteria bacterium]|nr:hypothetical protein [Candidatus Peregrinibacteria bacterium]